MNYSFATDTEKIESLKNELNTEIGNVSEAISSIYNTFDSLASEKIWSGKAYDSFKLKADSYKDNLENVVNILNSYVSVLNEVETQFSTLHSEISSTCTLEEE